MLRGDQCWEPTSHWTRSPRYLKHGRRRVAAVPYTLTAADRFGRQPQRGGGQGQVPSPRNPVRPAVAALGLLPCRSMLLRDHNSARSTQRQVEGQVGARHLPSSRRADDARQNFWNALIPHGRELGSEPYHPSEVGWWATLLVALGARRPPQLAAAVPYSFPESAGSLVNNHEAEQGQVRRSSWLCELSAPVFPPAHSSIRPIRQRERDAHLNCSRSGRAYSNREPNELNSRE
jgi:hypothetical protein